MLAVASLATVVGTVLLFVPRVNLLAPVGAGLAVALVGAGGPETLTAGLVAGVCLSLVAFGLASGLVRKLPVVETLDRRLDSTASLQRYHRRIGVSHPVVYGTAVGSYVILVTVVVALFVGWFVPV